jgi:hypothetical protein
MTRKTKNVSFDSREVPTRAYRRRIG